MSIAPPIDLLIVEDNEEDLEMSLRALKKANLAKSIHVAYDGVEALDFVFCEGAHAERSLSDGPRLILLDLKLPRVDGMEVLSRIKADPRTRTIPVVVLTSSNESSDVEGTYKLGANSFVVKPVSSDHFTEVLQDVGSYWLQINHLP